MKRIILVIIFCSILKILSSQEYRDGDTLYVWAEKGLKLHEKAEINSDIFEVIPYGTMVIVIAEGSNNRYSYNETEARAQGEESIPAIRYSGKFMKIKYLDEEGYAFSGLLSKLPPLKITYHKSKEFYKSESLKSYFEREFGVLKVLRNIGGDSTDNISQKIVYNNGIILDEEGSYCCWDNSYIIPDVKLHEVYLLVNIYCSFERWYKGLIIEEMKFFEIYPIYLKNNEYKLQTGPFEETLIKKESKFILLNMGGGN